MHCTVGRYFAAQAAGDTLLEASANMSPTPTDTYLIYPVHQPLLLPHFRIFYDAELISNYLHDIVASFVQSPIMSHAVPTEKSQDFAIHSQDASVFFSIPLELRRDIYGQLFDLEAGHHIQYMTEGKRPHHFRLTPCTAPIRLDDEERPGLGNERNPDQSAGSAVEGPIYMRRLLSSWGTHWMCEELALYPSEGNSQDGGDMEPAPSRDISSTLRVCKRM